jgi:hypothetical protein
MASFLLPVAPAAAQTWPAVAGTLAGTAGGSYVSMALITARARAGHYVFTPSQGLLELAPIPLGAVAGGILGYRSQDRLRNTVGFGALGFVAGTTLGAALGAALSDTDEGMWSSVVVGGGVGLLVGSVWGALRHVASSNDQTSSPAATFSLSVPW